MTAVMKMRGQATQSTVRHPHSAHTTENSLPKPNYAFEKRQRELAKKKKQDEKDARKREARDAAAGSAQPRPENSEG